MALHCFVNRFRYILKKIFQIFCYFTRSRNEQIAFFSSFGGTQYSDSPRAISEMLHVMRPSVRIVWSGDKYIQKDLPPYVEFVDKNSFRNLVLRSKSLVWVFNFIYPKNSDYKGSKVLYIQTWHGDRAFKKIGWAAYKDMGDGYKNKNYLPYLDDCDYLTVGSKYGEIQAKEGLNYKGHFIKYGLPRNDKLFFPEKHKVYVSYVKKKLRIPEDVHILLYAPTFRDYNTKNFSSLIDIESCIERLEEGGSKWIALVRAHFGSTIQYKEHSNIINVSYYNDMADLLLIADCLISDYSSCAGDYLITKRPCVLAIFDQNEYEKSSRTLWINPKDAGFVVAKNQDELNRVLSNISTYNFNTVSEHIMEKYGSYDVENSSRQVCDIILKWLDKHV